LFRPTAAVPVEKYPEKFYIIQANCSSDGQKSFEIFYILQANYSVVLANSLLRDFVLLRTTVAVMVNSSFELNPLM
jgi:hypothetical protein